MPITVTYQPKFIPQSRPIVNQDIRDEEARLVQIRDDAVARTGYDVRTYNPHDEDTWGPAEVQDAAEVLAQFRNNRLYAEQKAGERVTFQKEMKRRNGR